MAEVLSGRGRTQSRGDYVGPSSATGTTPGQVGIIAAGGSLHRPSRLLLGAGPAPGLSQDHIMHTLPPLSPGNHTSGSHAIPSTASGGGATASDAAAPPGTQPRSRIMRGGNGGASGSSSGDGVSSRGPGGGGGLTSMRAERQRAQAGAADRSHGRVAPSMATAAATSGAASTVKSSASGRPAVRLGRGSALAPGGGRQQQGGRTKGPVAGPNSAAARAAEARAAVAAAAAKAAEAAAATVSDDDGGNGGGGGGNGSNSYSDASGGQSVRGLSESGGGAGEGPRSHASVARRPSIQSQQTLVRDLHTDFDGGGAAAAGAAVGAVSGSSGGSGSGGSLASRSQLGIRSTFSPFPLSSHPHPHLASSPSPLPTTSRRSPRSASSAANANANAAAGTGTPLHAPPRTLSERLDDASPRPQQQQSLQRTSAAADLLSGYRGIGPLSMFGPLAAGQPLPAANAGPVPLPPLLSSPSSVSAATLRPAHTTMPAAGFSLRSGSVYGSAPGPGSVSEQVLEHGAMALRRTAPQGPAAAAGTEALPERGEGGPEGAGAAAPAATSCAASVRPSSAGKGASCLPPSGRAVMGPASRAALQEPYAAPAARETAAARVAAVAVPLSSSAAAAATMVPGPRMQAAAARATARAAAGAAAPQAPSAAAAAAGGARATVSVTGRNGAARVSGGGAAAAATSGASAVQVIANSRTRGSATAATGRIAGRHGPIGQEAVHPALTIPGAGLRGDSEGDGGSTSASAEGPRVGPFAALSAHLDLLNVRDAASLGHAGTASVGGIVAAATATAVTAARRRSSNVVSDIANGSGGGGGGSTAAGLRGAVRQQGSGHNADATPLGTRAGGGRGGGHVVATSHAAASATRLLFDTGNPFSSDDVLFDDRADSDSSIEPGGGAVRQGVSVRPPERPFRMQLNPQATEATSLGPTRNVGPSSRPPLPQDHQHHVPAAQQQQLQQQQQSRLRRRTSGFDTDDDGVIGGALVIGGGGGGAAAAGFQERFLADLRRRDAQRALLMQLLMVGGQEELLRQAEDEQLALALMLSLQEVDAATATGGSAGGGAGAAAAAAIVPRMVTVRVTHGPLLGVVATAATEPAFSYEELLALEDVKVTTPQDVLASLPYYAYDGAASAPDGACAICQCDYEQGEQLVRLPCLHVLHAACAKKWLGEYSKKCPVCKHEVC